MSLTKKVESTGHLILYTHKPSEPSSIDVQLLYSYSLFLIRHSSAIKMRIQPKILKQLSFFDAFHNYEFWRGHKKVYILTSFQATIEEAAAALEKLMLEARANEQSKPNIDVDIKILDSCCQLFAAIQVYIIDHLKYFFFNY